MQVSRFSVKTLARSFTRSLTLFSLKLWFPSHEKFFSPVLRRGMKPTIPSAMMVPVIPVPPILPVGYRFNPKDEELISYYLVMLLHGFYSLDMPIGVVNFWELEPWDLPGRSRIVSDDQVWYFFCKRVLHTDKKKRMFKRKTQAGHWKPTGESTNIDDLGKRSTLRFYKDSPKVEKTEWIAYEYEITQNSTLSNPDEFVIIKLMNSSGEKRTKIKTKMSKQKSKVMSTSTNDQNQTLDEIMTTSDWCSYQIPADFGNQDVGNTPIVSTFSIFNQSSQMASSCGMMNIASGNDHEFAPSDFECQNGVEMSAMSSHDTGEPSSWATSSYQNHSSVTEVQDCGYFSMRVSPHFPEIQEEYEQSDCLFASDFENEKLPSEVEDSPLKITPCTENQLALDANNQSCPMTSRHEDFIQSEEFNLSFLEDDDWCSLIDFDVDKETNETFPEVDVGVLPILQCNKQ